MKRTLKGIAAAYVVLGAMAPAAFASTPSLTWERTNIQFAHYTANGVSGYVKGGTTYMPIWYVLQALKQSGYDYTYDGKVLNITTPSGVTPDTSNIELGFGNLTIQINGTDVKKVITEVHKDPAGGKHAVDTTYIPIYYIQQILKAVHFRNTWDGTNWKGAQLSSTSVSAAKSSVSVGQGDQLTVLLKDSDGNTVTPDKVTYSVTDEKGNPTDGAAVSAGGVFVASQPGTYIVTANADGVTGSIKVVVYGAPAAVQLSAASSDIVANGVSTDRVTVKVVDANGNVVSNFNGTLNVSLSGTAATFTLASGVTQDSDFTSGSATTGTLTITNGTGTFLVGAGMTPGVTTTISVSGLTPATGSVVPASGVSYGTTIVTTVPQVATSISVTPSKKVMEVNDSSDYAAVYVQVNDQTGNPMLGGSYVLNATVTGGGVFSGGVTNTTVVVSEPGSGVVYVDGVQGNTGTYTVTVTGSNLATGTASITAAVAGKAAALTATDASPTFVQGGSGTTVTLGAVDAHGVPVTLPSSVVPEVFITDSNGNPVTNFAVTTSSGTSVTAGQDGGYVLPTGTTTFTIADLTSGTADAGTYTVVVKDVEPSSALTATSAFTITEQANSATALKITPSTAVLTPGNLSETVTVQVVDNYGNPVAKSGVSVTLSATPSGSGEASFNGGAYSTSPSVTLTTDANGKATATFVAQDYNGTVWNITASGTSLSPASGVAQIVDHPVASYSFKLVDAAPSGTYAGNTVYALAGDSVAISGTLVTDGLDAYGNSVPSGVAQYDNVTVTITHASGLQGLPSGSVSGLTIKRDTTSDVETITGTLRAVSDALSSGLAAGKAGQVTVSVKDNTTGATGSASINVVPSNVVSKLELTGITNNETLATGTAYKVTVTLEDQGGNPVAATSAVTLNLSSSPSSSVAFETMNYVPTNSVTIQPGQSSVSFYVVTPTSPAVTSGLSVTVSGTVGGTPVSATVTGLSD